MKNGPGKFKRPEYDTIFIVDTLSIWEKAGFQNDPARDAVLTYDFALFNHIRNNNGEACFTDLIEVPEVLERYNHEIYHFFNHWFKDRDGKDVFQYKDISFGNSFRLEYWNDITYFVRLLVNLHVLAGLRVKSILVVTKDNYLIKALDLLGLKYTRRHLNDGRASDDGYLFPIFRWMDERVRPGGLMFRVRGLFSFLMDVLIGVIGRFSMKGKKTGIFIQDYYPTHGLIEALGKDDRLSVILEGYSFKKKGLFGQRRVPEYGWQCMYRNEATRILKNASQMIHEKWVINGSDISVPLYEIIMKRVEDCLPRYLKMLDNIIRYMKRNSIGLHINVTANGMLNSLVSCYCYHNGIPNYCIINGLLMTSFMDEALLATKINAYSVSIREHYFRNQDNIITLGDPRMDSYALSKDLNVINREHPTIMIGAGGFSGSDLNYYLAFEFDFLYDIVQTLCSLRKKGREMEIVIKVRSNGYVDQYRKFMKELFPGVPVRIEDQVPFQEIIRSADLYLSISSQTLFEASLLKIPVIFYRKVKDVLYPPFDGRSELVTADDPDELMEKIESFYNNSAIFNDFMNRSTMEKYIGPLDGKNLDRNLDYIYPLLGLDRHSGATA